MPGMLPKGADAKGIDGGGPLMLWNGMEGGMLMSAARVADWPLKKNRLLYLANLNQQGARGTRDNTPQQWTDEDTMR